MNSIEEDEKICPEQIVEEIIPSTWQVPFFGQYHISLQAASSSVIVIPSFVSIALTGLFGGYHKLKQNHANY